MGINLLHNNTSSLYICVWKHHDLNVHSKYINAITFSIKNLSKGSE